MDNEKDQWTVDHCNLLYTVPAGDTQQPEPWRPYGEEDSTMQLRRDVFNGLQTIYSAISENTRERGTQKKARKQSADGDDQKDVDKQKKA